MKKCAYCGRQEDFTKEHIWPSAIIRKHEETLQTYNKRSNNFYVGDPVIKDVCATCNNTKLSKLDSYMSDIYDKYLFNRLMPGDNAVIEYDFQLLLRGLLKVSYNSIRASGEQNKIKTHTNFAKYILEGGYCPDIMLRLQVVTAAKIIVNGELQDQHLDVTQLRVADIAYDGPLSSRFMVRLVAINSYWFYIIMSHRKEAKHKWREFTKAFCSWKIQAGIHLQSNTTRQEIPKNLTTYMHPTLLGNLLTAPTNT